MILQEESQQRLVRGRIQRRGKKEEAMETREIKSKNGRLELKTKSIEGILQAVWFQVNKYLDIVFYTFINVLI